MKEKIRLTVDREIHDLEIDSSTPLLYVLRNELEKNGPKFGCGLGQCGSCMILMDGQAIMSCLVPTSAAHGKTIVTLAGLINTDGQLHPVQQAFIDEQAAQCGYCTNGMIMSAVALLNRNPQADEQDIRRALQINLCRCGSHPRVLKAIRKVVKDI